MNETPRKLRILHTSDWHLGRQLYERSRDDEFDAFLSWMLKTIQNEKIDILLIAGDIFDTSNPSHASQERYYRFCTELSKTCCRHAVVTSGNHDSTSFIDVPGTILECLNVHVIGQSRFGVGKTGNPEDEVIVLRDKNGIEEAIIAAVPFLGDSDVRTSGAGEETAEKEKKILAGVANHYNQVAEAAEKLRNAQNIPVIGMGHLFVEGGKYLKDGDDGVRMTYVGSLGGVKASIFSPTFDYVALGHLHVPQIVGEYAHIRYSGSPLPMGFGESGQQKSVYILDCEGRKIDVQTHPIPTFHRMESIVGDRKEIIAKLQALMAEDEEIYVSVTYTGDSVTHVTEIVNEVLTTDDCKVRCLITQNQCKSQNMDVPRSEFGQSSLNKIDETRMFELLLDKSQKDDEDKRQLMDTFKELLIQLKENS